jgi:hypothetical protein
MGAAFFQGVSSPNRERAERIGHRWRRRQASGLAQLLRPSGASDRGIMDIKALIVALLTWISSQIGCEPPPAPEIRLAPHDQLVTMAYGSPPPAGASVTALYDGRSKTVYLEDSWRLDSLANRATLVHELVHHVQELAAIRYPCLAARERLAYQLQAKWLKEQGIADPYAFLQIDEFTIAVLSLCLESE